MSNLDVHPDETVCHPVPDSGPVAEFYEAREVPLGGIRGVMVKRALPQRVLPTVGAWCFLDQFGPHSKPMSINPHPHIGLQTVTWPFQGEFRHRDSIGSDTVIRPGQLNLMTSGRGIAHSEFVVGDVTEGHGLQFWTALPGDKTGIAPAFEQHRELPVYEMPGLRASVLIGSLGDVTSPATAFSPLLGADLRVEAGVEVTIPLTASFEHAVLAIDGDVKVAEVDVAPGPLLYLGTHRSELMLTSRDGAHLVLLGGEPFREELVMWWNFVGRSHEEIVAAREDWEGRNLDRFADIAGHAVEERIPAPPLPGVRLKPRGRR